MLKSKLYGDGIHDDTEGIQALLDTRTALVDLPAPGKKNVHIRNVYGTYYQYCIGVTKFYDEPSEGYFDGLVFDNIFASKAERKPVYRKDGMMVFPLIRFERGVTVRNVTISNVFRVEERVKTPTVCVDRNATVGNMLLDNVVQENRLSEPFPLLENNGEIQRLSLTRLRTNGDALTAGDGAVKTITTDRVID